MTARRALIAALLACPPATAAGFQAPAAPPSAAAAAPPAAAPAAARRLTAEALDRSIALGRRYLLNCQRPDGSFIYEMDAVSGTDLNTRNAVREMGGLWAIAALHRQNPTPETSTAIITALRRQGGFARRTAAGARYLTEPGAREWKTNVVALYVLALHDFLETDQELDAAFREQCRRDLADTVKFLMSLRLPGGRFASTYRCDDGRPLARPTPYSDGEVLLALARVAKAEGGDASLRDALLESAAVMYGQYVKSALRDNPQSDDAKGFYQWGSMAFYELYTSGWPGTQPYAARTIAMARWMTDVMGVAKSPHNTGYAVEGMAVAWELARLTNATRDQQAIGAAIDAVLSKLVTWQIGSPVANPRAIPPTFGRAPKTHGGAVMNEGDARIRIDVVQHQVHAMMLARWFRFPPTEAADGR